MPKKFVYIEGVTKKHEVLKEAMKYLSPVTVDIPTAKQKKFEFVCQCINKAVNDYPLEFWDDTGLIEEIEIRLKCETLNTWLFRNHCVPYEEQRANQGRKIQATRRAWMQSMYEEFKAKNE